MQLNHGNNSFGEVDIANGLLVNLGAFLQGT